ncbi:response regulator [Pseudomonas denitrificans (nom. rej.)]|nr:response regulator [Pseudomonas denitrificans (nom. rej.)]
METSARDRPEHVLILDDDATLTRVLGLAMEYQGIPSVAFGNADDGLVWINANPGQLALLLTDISMPGSIDGAELARQVAERMPDVPIIIMSGGSWSSDLPECQFLDKPFDLKALTTIIKGALGRPN